LLQKPANVLACDTHTEELTVKRMQCMQVRMQDLYLLRQRRRGRRYAAGQPAGNLAAQPGASLRGVANHHNCGFGVA
jgi:hypothetical protein